MHTHAHIHRYIYTTHRYNHTHSYTHTYTTHTHTDTYTTYLYTHTNVRTHTHVHEHICAHRSCYLTPWAGLWGKGFLFRCWHQRGAACFPVLCCWAHSVPASQQLFPIVGFTWQQFIQTVWNAVSFQKPGHWRTLKSDEALKQIYWNFQQMEVAGPALQQEPWSRLLVKIIPAAPFTPSCLCLPRSCFCGAILIHLHCLSKKD